MQTETQTKEKTMKHETTLDHGPRTNDNWTKGTATCNGLEFKFNVKHFDEPSEFGIRGGRISKLWLSPGDGDFRHTILNYDRKWERGFTPRGKGAEVNAVYQALIAKFN